MDVVRFQEGLRRATQEEEGVVGEEEQRGELSGTEEPT